MLGSKEGGGKLMVACTENTIAAERYNAVELLRSIIPNIKGGGGGRPTMAQGEVRMQAALICIASRKDLVQS